MKCILGILLASLALGAQAQRGGPSHRHRISASQASRTALAKYPGKVVGKVNLENEEGKWQYSVNVRSRRTLREIMVDANTGKIADVEVTTAKAEAREAAAEKKPKGHRH